MSRNFVAIDNMESYLTGKPKVVLYELYRSSPRHSECLQKKRDLRDQMESKIDSGLDRTLTAITGYVKYMLGAEQKKTDFKPDDDSAMLAMVSPVSYKIDLLSQLQVFCKYENNFCNSLTVYQC